MRICIWVPSDNERLLAIRISSPQQHAGTLHPGDNNCSTTGIGHHCLEKSKLALMQRTTSTFVRA
jgi:hypothetical protein